MSTRPTRSPLHQRSTPSRRFIAPFCALFLLIGLGGCDLFGSGGEPLARAGELTFSVEEAATLMESRGELPNNEDIVRALAELWVDYALLAQAAYQDSTLQSVDVSSIVDTERDQQMIVRFRDSVVEPDTTFTEEELRSEFDRLGAGVELQARHILLALPENATDAQRDSAISLAEDLAQRAREGADFAELAREYSDDPGSAQAGGELGTFGRGQMVPAIEEAAFALDTGEISGAVETPFGIHVIQVEGRNAPDFEENREQFTEQLRARRTYVAESVFVTDLEASVDPQVQDDAYSVLRELAARPAASLSENAGGRALVTYDGGEVTAREARSFLRARAPQERAQVEAASEEQLDMILSNLTRMELLASEAREAGMAASEAQRDSMQATVRAGLRNAVRSFGLTNVTPQEGESEEDAIERAVATLLVETLQGSRNVLPLGALTFTFQDEFGARIYDSAIPRVVEAVEAGDTETSPSDAGAPDPAAGTPDPGPAGGTP